MVSKTGWWHGEDAAEERERKWVRERMKENKMLRYHVIAVQGSRELVRALFAQRQRDVHGREHVGQQIREGGPCQDVGAAVSAAGTSFVRKQKQRRDRDEWRLAIETTTRTEQTCALTGWGRSDR